MLIIVIYLQSRVYFQWLCSILCTHQVAEIRNVLSEVQKQLGPSSVSAGVSEAMRIKMEKAGEDFLK